MGKDPAVLIYFDKWISSTNGMKAEFRAWYFDLLIHQYDKGEIPKDVDELAGICRVRPSEYDSFKHMVKQVLEQKFTETETGWINEVAMEVLKKREAFVDKRKKSGNIGVVIKTAKTIKGFNLKHLGRLKKELYGFSEQEIERHKNKQVLEHVLKLYINVDVNEDIDIKEFKNKLEEKIFEFYEFRIKLKKPIIDASKEAWLKKLNDLSKNNEDVAIKILDHSIANGYQGIFKLKDNGQQPTKNNNATELDDFLQRSDQFLRNNGNNNG